MPLSFQVLGQPGRDNALFVKLDSGQAQTRFLFDCGDGCPHQLPAAELREIDHLCFSHLHIDHVAGFDLFFRTNFNRTSKENRIWVPPGSGAIIGHRLRGFLWNLVGDRDPGEWLVSECGPDAIRTVRYCASEGFAVAHPEPDRPRRRRVIVDGGAFTLEAVLLDHGTPSAGYIVREAPHVNVDTEKLAALGLSPGPWLKRLRDPGAGADDTVAVAGARHSLARLRRQLLVTTPGDSIAYLTDFRVDASANELATALHGVNTVVCESHYRSADAHLAAAAMHSTAAEVAAMAKAAGVGRLILFHVSDRYDAAARRDMLLEAQAVFAATAMVQGW